jgi:hypothetical protein
MLDALLPFAVLGAVAAAVVGYVVAVRPVLRALPAFRAFYAEADGFWAKTWAVCGRSATMAWSYLLLVGGTLLSQLDTVATLLGEPAFKEQFATLVHADPTAMGIFTMAVSIVTMLSRLRSIGKAEE